MTRPNAEDREKQDKQQIKLIDKRSSSSNATTTTAAVAESVGRNMHKNKLHCHTASQGKNNAKSMSSNMHTKCGKKLNDKIAEEFFVVVGCAANKETRYLRPRH